MGTQFSFDFYPKPDTSGVPHRVIMRRSESGEIVGVGEAAVGDDVDTLRHLWLNLRQERADPEAVRSAGRTYGSLHRTRRGGDPDPEIDVLPRCSRCGARVEQHPPGACLDQAVHESFLCLKLEADEAPPYSSTDLIDNSWIDNVTCARRWPRWVVRKGGSGWIVGPLIDDTQQVFAEGENFALAVCRAALVCPPWGDDELEVRVPLL